MRWLTCLGCRSLLGTACWLLLPCYAAAAAPDGTQVDFNRDVLPILSDRCFQCHGPDEQTREANLRLDTRDGLFGSRDGSAPFVPGKPQASEAFRRLTSSEPFERMPPPDSGLSLTPQQIDTIRRWLQQGAQWEQHWAFVPVQPITPPAIDSADPDAAWVRNPIDLFVLNRLRRENLRPSPPASKETLIRRVTLDLTGLPPTPGEVDAFLADDAPDAYERLVDRLLASDRYGEQMALMWLDAARYADTDGYQNDGPRTMWRWRDWVIDAYNANMPFDRFALEQLAGDLLPDATLDQKIATGFSRNHRYNSEAGLVLEEFLLENAVDRVDTTATVFMGLTLGCARCHDHKYDPFSQREYYQLIAYFDQVTESGRAVKFGNSEPWVVSPTPHQQEQLAQFDGRLRKADAALKAAQSQIAAAQAEWEAAGGEGANADDQEHPLVSAGLTHRFELEALAPPAKEEKGKVTFTPGIAGQAANFDGKTTLAVGPAGSIQCQTRSSIAFWLKPAGTDGVILSQQARSTRRPGVAVELAQGRLQFYIIGRWIDGVGAVETIKPLAKNRWVHVCLTNDGSQSARGMRIYLDGKPAETRFLHNTNSNTGGTPKDAVLRLGGGVHGGNFRGQIDEVRYYDRTLWDDEIAVLAVPESIATLRDLPLKQRAAAQQQKLQAWFLEHAAPQPLRKLAAEVAAARAARLKFWDSLPTTMVMEDYPTRRPTYVRVRGVYDQYGDEVSPGVPAIFPPLPPDAPANRLGFARWLVSGEHPLTARVAVNRYWQKYFENGLVKTSEDFGVQGEPPSHPELLDWLAGQFVDSGWDIKAMQRLIVTSATYRQASTITRKLLERDPENRLLARGPRSRLPAHVLRDQALLVSGLLVEQRGGPSVSPYQPAGLWEELSNMTYRQSKGADLYRRSLYTFWKRTVAPPSLAVLDAADRETCAVRPKRTNTPLQALTLLNETAFVESARQLAQRMLLEGGDDPVTFAFRLLTARQPTSTERELLNEARAEYLAAFRADPAAAKKLLAVGQSPVVDRLDPVELAAHTVLANVLLNLDETLTKE